MNIAIEGCLHGELTTLYQTITQISQKNNISIDVLLVCGDFQCLRDPYDMQNMACPVKYQRLGDFPLYFTGQLKVPYLTIFIGGNHEASNYLQELYYGGWVAPNIYYLGSSGVIRVKKGEFEIKIAGISGIYNEKNFFMRKNIDKLPLDGYTKRSAYHSRELEIFKLYTLQENIDIVMSHDWPCGIYNFGDIGNLLRRKPFFQQDINGKCLGSPALRLLLEKHMPKLWFSAHLHVKFSAFYQESTKDKGTFFLALDKVMPRRDFLQFITLNKSENTLKIGFTPEKVKVNQKENNVEEVKREENMEIQPKTLEIELYHDAEWLAILSQIEPYYEKLQQKGSLFEYSLKNSECFNTPLWVSGKEYIDLLENIKISKEIYRNKELKINKILDFSNIYLNEKKINKQTEDFILFLGLKIEKYEGFLYQNIKKLNRFDKKEIKLLVNNEEIPLDLDEECEDIPKKTPENPLNKLCLIKEISLNIQDAPFIKKL